MLHPLPLVHWNQLRVMWDGAAGRRHRFLLESRVVVEVALCWVVLVQLPFDEWMDGWRNIGVPEMQARRDDRQE
jgi:hypothetical protein